MFYGIYRKFPSGPTFPLTKLPLKILHDWRSVTQANPVGSTKLTYDAQNRLRPIYKRTGQDEMFCSAFFCFNYSSVEPLFGRRSFLHIFGYLAKFCIIRIIIRLIMNKTQKQLHFMNIGVNLYTLNFLENKREYICQKTIK